MSQSNAPRGNGSWSEETELLATRELLEQWSLAPLPELETSGNEQAQIQALRGVLRGVSQRRERRRRLVPALVSGVVAAAAIVLVVLSGGLPWSPATERAVLEPLHANGEVHVVSVEQGGQVATPQSLRSGDVLRRGAKLATASGQLNLQFPSGATAELREQSLAQVSQAGEGRREALFLSKGVVEVEVPKLAQPVEFSVTTPDALVVVHGTRFRVEVVPGDTGTRTAVQVMRGVVSVHVDGEPVHRLTAGQQWPQAVVSDPAPVEPSNTVMPKHSSKASPPPSARKRRLRSPRGRRSTEPRRRASRRRVARSSEPQPSPTLTLENAQFSRAMRHKKAGDRPRALASVEALLRSYPQSVLAQEARVERFRLLRNMGENERAVTAARAYLAAHPGGYARREARQVIESE